MVARRSKAKKAAKARGQIAGRRWVAKVKTDFTHPKKGLFAKDASTIARALASKKVSPKGPGSGMRMLTYFINRGGKGLSAARRRKLERAKRLLPAASSKSHDSRKVTVMNLPSRGSSCSGPPLDWANLATPAGRNPLRSSTMKYLKSSLKADNRYIDIQRSQFIDTDKVGSACHVR